MLEVNRIRQYQPARGLFVAVDSGGCAGFAYRLEMVDSSKLTDAYM